MTETWRHSEYGFQRSNDPDLIVVHAMAEILDMDPDITAADFLDKLGFSAHALICPDGTIIRCRHDEEGAYHAKGHNERSLGVEILTPGVHTYATWARAIEIEWVQHAQYQAAIGLVSGWMRRFDIPLSAVVRHSDIDPERKIDPGPGFPWEQFCVDLDAMTGQNTTRA